MHRRHVKEQKSMISMLGTRLSSVSVQILATQTPTTVFRQGCSRHWSQWQSPVAEFCGKITNAGTSKLRKGETADSADHLLKRISGCLIPDPPYINST